MQTSNRGKRLTRPWPQRPLLGDRFSTIKCAVGILAVAIISAVGAYGEHPIHGVAEAQQMSAGIKLADRDRSELTNARRARFELAHGHIRFDGGKP